MALTKLNTEKLVRVSHVYIGVNATTGVDIQSGIKRFTFSRVHDARRKFKANTKTAAEILQPHSHYTWRLEFLSDCRQAFFATDVSATGGNQYAIDPNGNSTKIDYFKVLCPLEGGTGAEQTRTFTITNGYVLRNHGDIGNDEDAIFWYEGDAEEITYGDV